MHLNVNWIVHWSRLYSKVLELFRTFKKGVSGVSKFLHNATFHVFVFFYGQHGSTSLGAKHLFMS